MSVILLPWRFPLPAVLLVQRPLDLAGVGGADLLTVLRRECRPPAAIAAAFPTAVPWPLSPLFLCVRAVLAAMASSLFMCYSLRLLSFTKIFKPFQM